MFWFEYSQIIFYILRFLKNSIKTIGATHAILKYIGSTPILYTNKGKKIALFWISNNTPPPLTFRVSRL